MRLVLLSASAVLTLAACSGEPAEPEAPEAPPAAAPVLAGVDLTQPLRALGTEPFWSVDLNGARIAYSGVDRPEETGEQSAPVVQGTVATWETTTDQDRPLAVTLTATACSDGMSDREYPLTAIVKIGDETLTGCAAPTAAIMVAPESGPVAGPVVAPPPAPMPEPQSSPRA